MPRSPDVHLTRTTLYNRINLTEKQWSAVNFLISILAFVLIFAGACTIAVSDSGIQVWQAGAAFAFICSGFWLASAILAWKGWAGKFCWEK